MGEGVDCRLSDVATSEVRSSKTIESFPPAPTTAQYGPTPPTTYHMASLDWLGALGSPVNDQTCLMVSEPATTDERLTYVRPRRSWLGDVVSSYPGRLLSFVGRAAQPRPRKELAHFRICMEKERGKRPPPTHGSKVWVVWVR